MVRSTRALKRPVRSGCKLTVPVPISVSRRVVYNETPTLVTARPEERSLTATVKVFGPALFGFTVSATVNAPSSVVAVVSNGGDPLGPGLGHVLPEGAT